MNSIICLMGPTAAGKTALALQLAEKLSCEIISVDSAMIYRGMDIGTGKPSKEILAKIPHYLIDICDPTEIYSAARFCSDTTSLIQEIHARGNTALLVGGTMLYFRALISGLSDMPSADTELRMQLQSELVNQGLAAMHNKLQSVDPVSAQRIHVHDQQRLLRALEVYYQTGKPLSAWHKDNAMLGLQHQVLNIAITPLDRSLLHEKIALRFQKMLMDGFVDEVEQLYKREHMHEDLPSMRAVGYRQICLYLKNEFSYADMQERGIIATRQLAKRQLTWLRSWPELHWFDSEDNTLIEKVLRCLNE